MKTRSKIEDYLQVLLPEVAAEFCGVSKCYGETPALNNVSFRLHPGELVSLLGANGAGKTTAVKLLLGLAAPNQGRVRIFGQSPHTAAAKMRIGAMLQVGKVPETLKVREHIELFSCYYPRPLPLATVIETAGLQGLENRLFGELSGGQKQRVLFALAICGDPDLLFLDEPTVGLDVDSRRAFWREIRAFVERGRSVLLTTHYLEESDALADRILVLNRGTIVAEGTPKEIKSSVAGKTIRCTTALSVHQVQAIAGVSSVRVQKDGVEILTSRAEAVLRELLARDASLANVEITGTGLEEAFLEITRRDGRNSQREASMEKIAL
ncbi:MAG TPA: ABC transporter ATP-binding protein [Terriglobales bacterium]|jgi:ABC-2 type transport system ATP-binding protein|nr:ABC transporter ATP-binding protein [Terriglobales bacterium]